jgi:flagellar motor switch protein FliN
MTMWSERRLIEVLGEKLAGVVGTRLGAPEAATQESTTRVASRWVIRVAVTGAWTGTLHVGLSEGDADWLVRSWGGRGDEAVTEDDIQRDLGEIANHAAQAVAESAAGDLNVTMEAVVGADDGGQPSTAPVVVELLFGQQVTPHVAVWATPASAPEPMAMATPNLDVVLDIEVPLLVRFGQTEMSLQALTRLAQGSVIALDRSPDEQVDVMVNGRVVARGDVVVVGGNYGVRVTEVSPPCRSRVA